MPLTTLTGIAAVTFALQAADAPQVDEILSRAANAYRSTTTLQADFLQQIEIPALEQTRRGRGVVYQKKPNFFMMKFEEPAGDVVVADGRFFWMYYPSAHPEQVVKTAIEHGKNQATGFGSQFVTNPSERYAATYVRKEDLNGRPSHVLALVPKFAAPYNLVRVWIDASDYLVRKFEVYEQNDSVRTVELSNLRAGIDLADELFKFSPPEGVEVFSG